MSSNQNHHNSHNDPNIPYHVKWEFRREALIWSGEQPIGINFHPIATELHKWLLRQGQISLLTNNENITTPSLTNPYSYDTSTLAGIITHVINSGHDFAKSASSISDTEVKIECIRLYNEHVLYTARFCEASIKQLLYCTQIPKKYYKDASIGALLSTECRACKGSDSPHKISMLGSLAHRYSLCLEFEECLFEHLKIANRRRNLEAAHSGTQPFSVVSAKDSRDKLLKDSLEIGNELVHMVKHISDLESLMIAELKNFAFPSLVANIEYNNASVSSA